MRPLSVTMLGTALVAAGLLAPATGEAATRHGGVAVDPGTARAGEKVYLSVSGCNAGRHWASSEAFGGRSRLDGRNGSAVVRNDAKPGVYRVVVHCGQRTATGKIRVAGRLAWPPFLPGTRDGL
ncbi:hypothetical protein [Actinomadura napierensis]|uniref:Secreted protein n=1 Tax=Actinomadura napierensis TaxID=267854 RepID=A0ABN2ZTC1_9ACTN